MGPAGTVRDLPSALHDRGRLATRLAGRRPAVFLDYDGVLTPIVDRPEDAVISDGMRETVRHLAARCPVCVVSGRDRTVVQRLMGIDDLVVAGSHGFDIWSPGEGVIAHDPAPGSAGLIAAVAERLWAETGSLDGVIVEPKRASVAVHYRLAAAEDRDRVVAVVRSLQARQPDEIKIMPGKMVYEIQPKVDWDKGRAVLYLLEVFNLGAEIFVPLYLGDDVTDEDAFRVLRGRGIGIIVGHPDDTEVAGRPTEAEFALASPEEVERFLTTLGY
ncbi:trehalose-phosphatase [Nonomuraea guangzhouensis]|uniref:Trehalose 6-phosphate phosphatase n=1 Tax=Nonomuraea guangzhouensis TaxID=1291555 RepID=A0ABW4GRH1_9ACTN|nr:trehalose-phosphatase [Nonomuraea guangzhouensis]